MERPNVEQSGERHESAEHERVAQTLVQEADFMPEAKRESQRRFGSAMMLGTVLAGALAAGEASAGDYRRSDEYRRYGDRARSSEIGRRIATGAFDVAETIQARKAEQARLMYDELFNKLQKLERQIATILERAEHRAQRAESSDEAQAALQEGKQEAGSLMQEREVLGPLVREAGRKAQKEEFILRSLRESRYIFRR